MRASAPETDEKAMFQTFEGAAPVADRAGRLAALRARLADLGLDAFIVPRTDAHQSEYIPPSDARLEWLTGFTGSAGTVLVRRESAALLIDGRYTEQARNEVDTALFEPVSSVETPLSTYIEKHAGGEAVGFDPWLTTLAERRRLQTVIDRAGGTLVPVSANPIDALWMDRPAPPAAPAFVQPEALAGRSVADKLADCEARLVEAGVGVSLLTDAASIAWVFNIRGGDVAHNPLALAFALLRRGERPIVFIDPAKLDAAVRAHLDAHAEIAGAAALAARLGDVAARPGEGGATARIGLDPQLAASRLADIVEEAGGEVVDLSDPARHPRAVKNAVEIAGSRAAHRRDGAAMVAFLAWLDAQPPGTVSEIRAVERLEACRRTAGEADGAPLREIAFDTIAGAGPHGSIVHYRVTRETDRTLDAGDLFLCDSGGQYRDGTTDITRTVAIGEPAAEQRRLFTLVLKGMIAVSTARFPVGTRGVDLDVLARDALWRAGLDYAHGTGHGVGAYLNVHEGPQSISRRGMVAIEPGMILSDEPGYYREGAFGIRIENLILATGAAPIEGGDRPMMGFETLTLCPIDRRLIEPSLLGPGETAWLDVYHARVWEEISPMLGEAEREWLAQATRPIGDPV